MKKREQQFFPQKRDGSPTLSLPGASDTTLPFTIRRVLTLSCPRQQIYLTSRELWNYKELASSSFISSLSALSHQIQKNPSRLFRWSDGYHWYFLYATLAAENWVSIQWFPIVLVQNEVYRDLYREVVRVMATESSLSVSTLSWRTVYLEEREGCVDMTLTILGEDNYRLASISLIDITYQEASAGLVKQLGSHLPT